MHTVFSALKVVVLAVSTTAGSAVGATLNLNDVPAGSSLSDLSQIAYSDASGQATLDNYFGFDIAFWNSQYINSNTFCFRAQFSCVASGAVIFNTPVWDLAFTMAQTSTINLAARADIYSAGVLLHSLAWSDIIYNPQNPTTPGPTRRFDFSGFGPIEAVVITPGDDAYYGDFSFNVAPVPSPPSLALFFAALLGIALRRHLWQRQGST